MDPKGSPVIDGFGLLQLVPIVLIGTPLPDIARRRIAKNKRMIADHLEERADFPRFRETNLPPPIRCSSRSLPRRTWLGRKSFTVGRALGWKPRRKTGRGNFTRKLL